MEMLLQSPWFFAGLLLAFIVGLVVGGWVMVKFFSECDDIRTDSDRVQFELIHHNAVLALDNAHKHDVRPYTVARLSTIVELSKHHCLM